MTGIIGGVSITKLKGIIVPLPPLAEQKRIVAKIEELMPYVEQYDKAYTEVEELNKKFPEDMQKSILQYAIQGKLVEQREEDGSAEELYQQIQEEKARLIKEGKIKKTKALPEITEDEIPFDIPDNWKWVRLGSLAELITKGSSPSWQGVKYVNQGLLFVTSENVGIEQLLLDNPKYLEEKFNELQGRSILKKDDILTNIVGASIGRTTIYDRDELANINQAVCLIRLINSNMNGYIVKYLNSYVAYKIMMNDKVDTARANISLTNISDFVVPLPPLEEQKRIVEKIEELLLYTKQLVKKIN
jgi:type I restriction enzyme S subunit